MPALNLHPMGWQPAPPSCQVLLLVLHEFSSACSPTSTWGQEFELSLLFYNLFCRELFLLKIFNKKEKPPCLQLVPWAMTHGAEVMEGHWAVTGTQPDLRCV